MNLLLWNMVGPLFLLALLIFLVTQMVMPPFIGKRFFWIFRKSEKSLRESEDSLIEAIVENEVTEIKKQVKEVKGRH